MNKQRDGVLVLEGKIVGRMKKEEEEEGVETGTELLCARHVPLI